MSESNVISINDKEYDLDALDDKQRYFISQIQSCEAKAVNLQRELDLINTARNSYFNALVEILETEPEEEQAVN